jgi:phosphomannomutase
MRDSEVVCDLRASYAVKDMVAKYGGTALMNRVGHAFFKRRMREEGAIFGGEVTGHYYFRDNFYADNGFIPALLMLELMSRKGQTLHELLAPLRAKYFISGEINTKMPDMRVVQDKVDALGARYSDAKTYTMDGVSVEYPGWHFNVRASNTEPVDPPQSGGDDRAADGAETRRSAGVYQELNPGFRLWASGSGLQAVGGLSVGAQA